MDKGRGRHLTAEQHRALLDYWAVYQANYELIQAETMRFAVDHPEFGPLVRAIPAEQIAAQGAVSRERLRRAVEQNDWEEYEHELRAQGALYAHGQLSFAGWYDLIRAYQRLIVPLLVDAYGPQPEKLKAALIESQRFVDHAMVVVGEEYLAAKQRALVESQEAKSRVEDASRAKSDFLAMMSHELRTPLNAIIGFSEILVDGKFGGLTERQSRYVANIYQSGRHLLGLINDLLDLSKIEAGRLEVVRQSCATRRFVEEAAALLQPLADARRVHISVESPEGSVPAVLADAARVRQVLYNLLSNAIKFTSEGGSVSVGFERTQEGRQLRISVRDTGAGISQEEAARLWSPFVQLDNAKSTPRSGTGLGLALTRQLTELMGGTVGLDSTPGVGSTFFVELPIDRSETPESSVRPQGAPGAPLALVVDDDPSARELLELALQAGGFRTTFAASGEDGIAAAREHHPEIITLDVFLPTIDGWDVLRVLKGDPQTATIPVVMITIASDRRKAFTLGAVDHMVKPIDRRALLEILARQSFTTKVAERPVNILVVDDDPQQLELVRAELEPRGFRVTTAGNGRDGVAAARTGQIDLLLLDLVMPDFSGVEVVEALKREESTRAIPILLVTAADLTEEDHRRLNGDVEAILAKGTLATEALVDEIARVIQRRT